MKMSKNSALLPFIAVSVILAGMRIFDENDDDLYLYMITYSYKYYQEVNPGISSDCYRR